MTLCHTNQLEAQSRIESIGCSLTRSSLCCSGTLIASINGGLASFAFCLQLLADKVSDDLDAECRAMSECRLVCWCERRLIASVEAVGKDDCGISARAQVK